MIGSHDSLTYLKSNWFFSMFKKYWKTQCASIEEQYAFGIRMFDIRLYLSKDGYWRPCHGAVNLKGLKWEEISDVCAWTERKCPDSLYRIWLEKGSDNAKKIFASEVEFVKNHCLDSFAHLWRAGIKGYPVECWRDGIFNQNDRVFEMGYLFAYDYPWKGNSYELHGSVDNIDDLFEVNLRKEAKKINSKLGFFNNEKLAEEMIKSKEKIYMLDFATNRYK